MPIRRARFAYRLMDEEYTAVRPLVLWRRRLFIGAIIIAFLSVVWVAEMLYDNWRVNSGPSAWFMVSTPDTNRLPYAVHESVFGDGSTKHECDDELNRLPATFPGAPRTSCRRLLISDATQMRKY